MINPRGTVRRGIGKRLPMFIWKANVCQRLSAVKAIGGHKVDKMGYKGLAGGLL